MSTVESSCFLRQPSRSLCPTCVHKQTSARTAVVFAVVRYHKHDLPFEDVTPNKTATYAGDVLIALH